MMSVMEPFKKLTLDDIEVVRPFLKSHRFELCDYTLMVKMLWREFYNIHYYVLDDTLIFLLSNDEYIWFEYPLGANPKKALAFCKAYADQHLERLVFANIDESQVDEISRWIDVNYVVISDKWFDYIYDYELFSTLKGKKLSKKRNHVNRFKREYPNYRFERVTQENIDEVIAFYNEYVLKQSIDEEIYEEYERYAVLEFLNNFSRFDVVGGVLYVDDRVIGMSFGELIGDMVFVPIEKADMNYLGSYQILAMKFARLFEDQSPRLINREEDMGDAGLRKAKRSYYPLKVAQKYLFVGK